MPGTKRAAAEARRSSAAALPPRLRQLAVREILCANPSEPPGLEELGRLAGCSPFYLSRQFAQATGLTLS